MTYENDKNVSETADLIIKQEKRIAERVRDKVCQAREKDSASVVAEKLGYSRQYIYQVEAGDREPSLEFIDELELVYGRIS